MAWVPECQVVPLGGSRNNLDLDSSGESSDSGKPGHSGGRAHTPSLQELVLTRLHRERRLWASEDAYDRRLRRRCLRDQLIRKAREKYAEVVAYSAVSWEEYLRTNKGYQRTLQWVDRKIHEALVQETSKKRKRRTAR